MRFHKIGVERRLTVTDIDGTTNKSCIKLQSWDVRNFMIGTADDAPVAERALQGRPRFVRDPRTPRLAEGDVRSEERALEEGREARGREEKRSGTDPS